jgi:hypothetical protein
VEYKDLVVSPRLSDSSPSLGIKVRILINSCCSLARRAACAAAATRAVSAAVSLASNAASEVVADIELDAALNPTEFLAFSVTE